MGYDVHITRAEDWSMYDGVLLVAFEDGAATSTQMRAINQFVQKAATKWPNVKIVFQWL